MRIVVLGLLSLLIRSRDGVQYSEGGRSLNRLWLRKQISYSELERERRRKGGRSNVLFLSLHTCRVFAHMPRQRVCPVAYERAAVLNACCCYVFKACLKCRIKGKKKDNRWGKDRSESSNIITAYWSCIIFYLNNCKASMLTCTRRWEFLPIQNSLMASPIMVELLPCHID